MYRAVLEQQLDLCGLVDLERGNGEQAGGSSMSRQLYCPGPGPLSHYSYEHDLIYSTERQDMILLSSG
jgi:hypothetical protein